MGEGKVGVDLLSGLPASLSGAGTRGDRLVDLLRGLVGSLSEGDEIPSERAIAEHFGIARMTARTAVDRLVELGLVERAPRRGAFVSAPRFVHTRHLASYADDITARGMVPGGHRISATVREADADVAAALGIAEGDRYLDLVRLRTADGAPMAVTRSMLGLDRFPGIDEIDPSEGSLHGELERRWGVRAARHSQRIRAVLVSDSDAELLAVPAGTPGFEMSGISRDADGVVIEVGRSVYRADRYEVVLHTDIHAV